MSRPPKLLVIDNFDSFTFNLVDLLKTVGNPWQTSIVTYRNNEKSLLSLDFDGLIIAPGPGNPKDQTATGEARNLIKRYLDYSMKDISSAEDQQTYYTAVPPILGVCLGHQALAWWFGAEITSAEKPVHGHSDAISHLGRGPFQGIPSPFYAARYHSLKVDVRTLPPCLEPLAFSSSGELMAFQHRSLPIWGLQFHPESFLTQYGEVLITNFLSLVRNYLAISQQVLCEADYIT